MYCVLRQHLLINSVVEVSKLVSHNINMIYCKTTVVFSIINLLQTYAHSVDRQYCEIGDHYCYQYGKEVNA